MMSSDYKIIGYYSEEDQAYLLFAPDLPGCFADGETLEEAQANIATVINEWIEYATELGRKIPSPLKAIENTQSSVFDVAEYILSKTGDISSLMLQKLVYYCKAWSMAWFHTPIFPQEFEAWRRGPVCRELYERHEHHPVVSPGDIGGKHGLSDSEKHLIDDVLSVYVDEDPEWLSSLTHSEEPWKAARMGIPDDAASSKCIASDLIEQYYSKIAN